MTELEEFHRHQEAVHRALIAHAKAVGQRPPIFSQRHDIGARIWQSLRPGSPHGQLPDPATMVKLMERAEEES